MPSVVFACTSGKQTFVVPDQVTKVTIEAYGANSYPNSGSNRFGGYAIGDLTVTPGEVLNIYVGGEGTSFRSGGGNNGGYNGGGNSGGGAGCGGGGASDVRQGGTALSNRKIVAGGAGAWGSQGAGASSGTQHPGLGGGATGQAGGASAHSQGGLGGSQTTGGSAGTGGAPGFGYSASAGTNGVLGFGGTGGAADGNYGGGGGGGYYGGGGGGANGQDTGGSGGGGGSNYVGGVTNSTSTQGVSHPYFQNDGQVTITYNAPPNAPQLIAPANGTNIDKSLSVEFDWQFSDPDAGDTQSKADFRWRVGAGAWTTITAAATTNSAYVAAVNTWASYIGQSVEWQIQTYDSLNHSSGWSASSYFKPQNAPDAPSFSPAPTLQTNTPSVTFARGSNGAIAQYELRVVNDVAGAAGSTVYSDSGTKNTTGAPTSITAKMSNYAYTNGTSYHLQVRVANPSGVWSAWGDSGALVANINAPLAPTIAITPQPTSGSVTVIVTNPGSDPHAPQFNRLYRLDQATGIETLIRDSWALNSSYTDYTIGFNRIFSYRAEAVSSTGAVTSSA